MLIFDFHEIGKRLHEFRKKKGLTQIEVSELAGISDRTYADIERGNVNMRVETLTLICQVLDITPNDVLITESVSETANHVTERLHHYTPKEQETAFKLLEVYLNSLH